jgi:hypothetical protein
MRWTDLTLFGGLVIGLAGVVLTVRQAGRRWWARAQPRRRSTSHLEEIADLAGPTTIFGGITMMQLGNVIEHVRTLPPNVRFSLLAGAVVLLVLGLHLGRLVMRWQLRRLLAALDAESGEFTPRS